MIYLDPSGELSGVPCCFVDLSQSLKDWSGALIERDDSKDGLDGGGELKSCGLELCECG